LTSYQGSLFTDNGYKFYKWSQKELISDIENFNISTKLIQCVADIQNINIFVIDCENDKLYLYGGESFVPYKKNIFLINIDNTNDIYEPIYIEDNKFVAFNNDLILELVENPEKIIYKNIDTAKNNNINIINEPLDKYLIEIEGWYDSESAKMFYNLETFFPCSYYNSL
jgi:hypothetical protein